LRGEKHGVGLAEKRAGAAAFAQIFARFSTAALMTLTDIHQHDNDEAFIDVRARAMILKRPQPKGGYPI
jgi:hypothetical protein